MRVAAPAWACVPRAPPCHHKGVEGGKARRAAELSRGCTHPRFRHRASLANLLQRPVTATRGRHESSEQARRSKCAHQLQGPASMQRCRLWRPLADGRVRMTRRGHTDDGPGHGGGRGCHAARRRSCAGRRAARAAPPSGGALACHARASAAADRSHRPQATTGHTHAHARGVSE
jgi:hypothetical protein